MNRQKSGSVWMVLPLYIFTVVFVICPLIYMVALSFATPNAGYGVTWKFTLENYRNILESVYLNTFVESLAAGADQYCDHSPDWISFWLFYGKNVKQMEEKGSVSLKCTFLGEFTDPPLWVDHHSAEKRTFEFYFAEAGNNRETAVDFVQLSGGYNWNGLCAFAFYDSVCVFQRGKTGLVLCGGCQRSGSLQAPGLFYGKPEADTARTFVRCDPYLYSIHGIVFYCRYSGRK